VLCFVKLVSGAKLIWREFKTYFAQDRLRCFAAATAWLHLFSCLWACYQPCPMVSGQRLGWCLASSRSSSQLQQPRCRTLTALENSWQVQPVSALGNASWCSVPLAQRLTLWTSRFWFPTSPSLRSPAQSLLPGAYWSRQIHSSGQWECYHLSWDGVCWWLSQARKVNLC